MRFSNRMPYWKTEKAREMRKSPTKAEAALWAILRCRQVIDTKFRRQVPLLGFIADFYAPAIRLVVEVDGAAHDTRQEQDADRDHIMTDHCIAVLRFTNEQVFQSPESVRTAIRGKIAEIKNTDKSEITRPRQWPRLDGKQR